MGVLQRFERRLEGLVQGAFTKAFGGWVEPVEVAAALTREAEDRKTIVAAGRVLVPNEYVVELGPADAGRLRDYDEPLRSELASMVREAAQEHGWSFVGPVEVQFQETEEVDTGAFRIRSSVSAGTGPAQAPDRDTQGPRVEVAGAVHHLDGTVVVGRGAEAGIQLTDTGVSRLHVELEVQPEGIAVRDLGSTNGTYVNGRRVQSAMLADGDRITVGTTDLVVRTEG
ncbi:MAG TPA: DUF3662 and FHA domain-containing protein [Mycobacteriales bacterium]|nr:DUF3662 and FHA domain-containing protein [Mycobacteriales bacterium]